MELRRIEHGVVDSTNERALAAVAAGEARHGDVHVARAQTSGRGQRGNRWESAADEGLYLTLVLLPPPPPPHPAALTMGAGLAVRDAVRALGATGARLKWPNDVLVGERKLAGVLVETRGLDPARPHAAVGVGLNVAQRSFPDDLARSATSLALEGLEAARDAALARVLEALAARLDPPRADAELCAEYAAAAGLDRGPVVLRTAREELVGEVVELSLAGGVVLRTAGGVRAVPVEHVRALASEPGTVPGDGTD